MSKAAEDELFRLADRLVGQLRQTLRFGLSHGHLEDDFALIWEEGAAILRPRHGAGEEWLASAAYGTREAAHETQVRLAAVSGAELLVSSASAWYATVYENFAYREGLAGVAMSGRP